MRVGDVCPQPVFEVRRPPQAARLITSLILYINGRSWLQEATGAHGCLGTRGCYGLNFTRRRSPPSMMVRKWSCHCASALRTSLAYGLRL